MVTFGWSLLQFVNSVDYMTNNVFENIKTLTSKYILRPDGFGACYFSVLRPGIKVDGKDALKIIWSSDQNTERNVVRLYGDDGNSAPSLRAFTYRNAKPIWVTDKNRKKLHEEGAQFKNYWRWATGEQQSTEMPPNYIHMHSKDSYTLIAVPLGNHSMALGVLVIEFSKVIPYNQTAQDEVVLLSESFSQIIWLHDITQERERGTRAALKGLEENVVNMFSAVRPTLFFAYAIKADQKVIKVIRDILKKFEAHFELRDWQDINETGEINGQIIREISRCRYGICYFSEEKEEEKDGKKTKTFTDNSNVLIEAGMLQALRGGKEGEKQNWIPIREGDTELPFDFRGQRVAIVPRGDDGAFKTREFEDALWKMLCELLDIPSEDGNDSPNEARDSYIDSVVGTSQAQIPEVLTSQTMGQISHCADS